jgi:hypothetical protein
MAIRGMAEQTGLPQGLNPLRAGLHLTSNFQGV